ncbi:hypothetical protein ACE7GA_09195 [Roseomonas sp. CCTCC AB2023176]|uniref:hypothetical protein n=1 Tax=Roseomonas sp. CCTCC AB2023176 TaxID=3342640 RepID=UPI0035D9FE8E
MARSAPLVALLAVALVAVAGLPACAPDAAPGAAAVRPVAGSTYGTVVGARPAVRATGGAWRASLLAGLGLPGAAGTAPAAGQIAPGQAAVEYVVREDSGGEIATIQAEGDGLAVGDRVAIDRGDRTRLIRVGDRPARAGPPQPAAGASGTRAGAARAGGGMA